MAMVEEMKKLKAHDDARDSFPGEHWLVLGAGIGVYLLARRHPSFIARTLGTLASTALVARAASGRDGLSKVLRWTPLGGRIR